MAAHTYVFLCPRVRGSCPPEHLDRGRCRTSRLSDDPRGTFKIYYNIIFYSSGGGGGDGFGGRKTRLWTVTGYLQQQRNRQVIVETSIHIALNIKENTV